jgi:hypothetical protein
MSFVLVRSEAVLVLVGDDVPETVNYDYEQEQ